LSLRPAALWLAPLSFVLAGSLFLAAPANTSIPSSLVEILKEELNREFAILKTKANPSAYYMAYEVTEEETNSASATLGALIDNVHSHIRGVDTTIRIGSAQFDNYHPYRGSRARFTNFTFLSLDDDVNQIRRALWAESDRVYKAGAMRLIDLQTDEQLLAQEKTEDPDFSFEPPQNFSSRPPVFHVDMAAWTAKLRAWSAEFKKHPSILASGVSFQAQREIKTFVNTEGSSIVQGRNLLRIEISGAGIAPDGMQVSAMHTFEASDPSHLPSDNVVEKQVQDVAAKLDGLVKAPPAEPIVCPAILSGRAAAVFFHEIFGHAIEGHRQKDVTEGQTYAKMIGQRVMPDFLSVEFDPTRQTYNGIDLIGHYDYDDEGVKARPVLVVDKGVLKTFLLSRSPVDSFTHSNGHGRRQGGFEVVSRQSNLIVRSTRQVSDAELRRQLIEEIKRQGKPYGLYFEEVESGYTTTARRGLQAFTVIPLVVYRVYPDGRPDELIRGVDIVGTRLASFEKILATSDHAEVFNGYCGAESGSIPVSAVSPAILMSEIETQKKENAQQKPPLLPRPGT
jgi:TldD protein